MDRFAKNTVPAAKTIEASKTAPSILEDIADETHAKYGAELFAPRTRQELRDEADTMYRAGLLAKYLPKDAKQWTKEQRYAYATNRALVAFLAGAELGMLPLQAVRGIYFVEDQPSPAAKTLVGLIKKRTSICEYWQIITSTATECEIVTKRRGTPKEERLKVTLADFPQEWREEKNQWGGAKRPPWVLWPSRQLHARCSSWLAGMVYQDITLGFYAAEEMSSAAWERKYADLGRAVVQVPGAIESDEVIDQMVADVDGGTVEAPPVDNAQTNAPTPENAPAKPAPTRAELSAQWAELEKQINAVGEQATKEQLETLKAQFLAFPKAGGHENRCAIWNANEVLRGFWVAS